MTSDCEHKTEEHKATLSLTRATWVLVIATIALVMITGMLAAATHEEKQRCETSTEKVTEE